MNQYDSRQVQLMSQKIALFKNNHIKTYDFINDIRALLDVLSNDNSWKKDFYDYWFLLEQVYAVSLANQEPLGKYQKQIDEAIKGMEDIIKNIKP